MVQEGDRAPDVVGAAADGTSIHLAELCRTGPVVVYFYPKDNTTVCTKEACSFRDHAGEIRAAGGTLIGVSPDSAARHRSFIADHQLNFPLLADEDATIAKAFGVARIGGWLPPRRVTFVIDRNGIVRRVIASEFSAARHVDGALEALRALARP